MTIYTVMPHELVFDGMNQEPGPFVEVTINGVMLQVIPTVPGIGRIVRVISGPLQSYLNNEYAPGQSIRYVPKIEAEEQLTWKQ
ncbi:MAG: YlzJ-like family protein [Candidatus Cohnella colombiensis]|uniref:YlzJ-like family protein n=1 Tax=Candidatus Cohnella colombiensis TaxID=3121368 RepID=A0AA95EZ08_9BACL|nr:MAG: YlzJ-like family protein [Cohnella sp.]